MTKTQGRWIYIVVSAILAAFLLFVALHMLGCKPAAPPEVQIQNAMESLWVMSPKDNERLQRIPVPISWSVGPLNGLTLAATTVKSDSVHIVFDWQEIRNKQERLEPVIAHEIAHAYEAYNVYGFENFVALVQHDKDKPWGQRIVEKSAIALEDQTRAYLLEHYPKEFRGMSPHRRTF
jgi:hypothetical protein